MYLTVAVTTCVDRLRVRGRFVSMDITKVRSFFDGFFSSVSGGFSRSMRTQNELYFRNLEVANHSTSSKSHSCS